MFKNLGRPSITKAAGIGASIDTAATNQQQQISVNTGTNSNNTNNINNNTPSPSLPPKPPTIATTTTTTSSSTPTPISINPNNSIPTTTGTTGGFFSGSIRSVVSSKRPSIASNNNNTTSNNKSSSSIKPAPLLVVDVTNPEVLGLKIKKENNAPLIITGVNETGQGKLLGLCVNDIVEIVNGKPTSPMSHDDLSEIFLIRPLRLEIRRLGERYSPAKTQVGNRYDILWRNPINEEERQQRSKRSSPEAQPSPPPISGWRWRPGTITEVTDLDVIHRVISVQFEDGQLPITAKNLPTGLNDRYLIPFGFKTNNHNLVHHKYSVGDVLDVFWRGGDTVGKPMMIPAPLISAIEVAVPVDSSNNKNLPSNIPMAVKVSNPPPTNLGSGDNVKLTENDKATFAKALERKNISFSYSSSSNNPPPATSVIASPHGRWMMASVEAFTPYWIFVHYLDHPQHVEEWIHVVEEEDRIANLGHYTDRGNDNEESGSAQAQVDFREKMLKKGFQVVDVPPDGNCLFRAISLQVYGDQSMHKEVREAVCDYMLMNRDRFALYMPEDGAFDLYIQEKCQSAVWGDDPEIRAAEELYDRPVEIYSCDVVGVSARDDVTQPIKFNFEGSMPPDMEKNDANKIRLSFHGNNHYNAVMKINTPQPKISMRPDVNEQRIRNWRLGGGQNSLSLSGNNGISNQAAATATTTISSSNGMNNRKDSVMDL
jgi:hypothetical protein